MGVSGLTAADIPTNVTANNYLPLSGGTLSGDVTGNNLTLSGNLTVSGAQTLSGAITVPYLTATTSTASLFNGGFLSLASSTIGNGTQGGGLTISGGATTTGNLAVTGTFASPNFTGSGSQITFSPTLTTSAGGTSANTTYVAAIPSSTSVTGSYTALRSTISPWPPLVSLWVR
jgi:hypothetical protein